MGTNQGEAPEVNDKPIQLTGHRTFDGPYVHSSPNGTTVTIEKEDRKMVLDFKVDEK